MTSNHRPKIAAAVYNGLLGFEFGIASEVLGRDRTVMVADWYEFLPCRVEPGRLRTNHGLEIRPSGTLDDLVQADIVLVPGWRETLDRPTDSFLDALRAAHARGARLVTICTGVFPLAYAGLLAGRRVTTHWLHAPRLRREFPDIDVRDDALYYYDQSEGAGIFTSAGSAAGLDLCLAVIRADYGIRIANRVARRMVAPVHRDGGQVQYSEAVVAETDDVSFGPVLEWMENHLQDNFKLDDVARHFSFSLRTFQRRFYEFTSMSPHQWLVQQRVNRARELLESSDQSVERIATLSGFGSAANLRKHLGRYLGTTPRAYRSAFRASTL